MGCGPIYGQQEAGLIWKVTLMHNLTTELGFREAKNMESVYYHPERKTIVICHVDDPLVKTVSEEETEWFHEQLNRLFQMKEKKVLSNTEPMDWCSIRISLNEDGEVRLDNQLKIEEYGKIHGLQDCKPVSSPICHPLS